MNNEPTHETEDGKLRPGAAPLRDMITPDKVKEVEEAHEEYYKDADHRKRKSARNPQVSSPYSPLQNLMWDAMREYGEMNPSTIDGDTSLMMLGFANKIIEDMRAHPYFEMPDLDYYVALTDTRPIPDILIIEGLQAYYAKQQLSQKLTVKDPEYKARMNSIMYNRRYGNGKIQMEPRK